MLFRSWGRNEVVAGTRYGDLTSATAVAVSTGDKPARPGNVGALAFAVGQVATGSDTPNVDLSTAVSVATWVWVAPDLQSNQYVVRKSGAAGREYVLGFVRVSTGVFGVQAGVTHGGESTDVVTGSVSGLAGQIGRAHV